ncbi:MAG: hypothetical protein KZQ75_06300 [Candidatus Thiodiazotropha sp. (ex Myrtea spinifera)]|nr:hypothetical protein [Candidatus Thiodiazotropha sp. (ex Myrtea spinifera)]
MADVIAPFSLPSGYDHDINIGACRSSSDNNKTLKRGLREFIMTHNGLNPLGTSIGNLRLCGAEYQFNAF